MRVKKLYSGERTSGYVVADKWFLKVYHDNRVSKRLSNLLLGSKPEREYRFSKLFQQLGIPTTEAVSFNSVKFLGLIPENVGFVKFVYLDGLVALDKLVDDKNFEVFLFQSVEIIAKMHSLSFFHGDLAVSNVGLFNGKIYIFDLANAGRTFHPFFAHKEIFRFFHDLFKLVGNSAKFDYRELFEFYLSKSNLGRILRRKLEKDFMSYAVKRGIPVK